MFLRRLVVPLALGAALTLTPAAQAAGIGGLVNESGPLRDLAPEASPTDGAFARFVAFPSAGGTRAVLIVTGLKDSVGQTLGAHVHTGPCVAGQPATAGPHYNTVGDPTNHGDRTHEIWLDFTVRPGGFGVADTTVPFVIPPGGAGSVVVHKLPTAPGGAAGLRIACLPAGF